MRTVQTIDPSVPLRERLSLKLVLLFVGSFAAVLFVMMVWTFLSAWGDSRQLDAEANVQTPAITIDPKIQSDLAKAMSFDAIPTETVVHNPFIDHDGIGSNLTVTAAPTSNAKTAAANGPASTGAQVSRVPGMTQLRPVTPIGPVDIGTRARHDQWVERQSHGGTVEPESEAFGVEDLVPVGFVSGGDRPDEVILYSISLCRTFSFPAGTRFYDGTLYGFNQAEVIFTFDNGIRRKSYATNGECRSNSQGQTAGLSNGN